MLDCSLYIPENMFGCCLVCPLRFYHELIEGVDNITNVYPGIDQIHQGPWLSHKILVASILLLNRFTRNFLRHMASHEVVLASIYSASVELRATDFCFLLDQEVILDLMLKQYPVVLFRSIELPAQSASVNPLSLMSVPLVYNSPCSTVPCISLRTFLAAS